MSINNSPLKISSRNYPENYISNTTPNIEENNIFNDFNHFSSFPLDNNIQEQNIYNDISREKADSSFQKITFRQNNVSQNNLINSFKDLDNINKKESNINIPDNDNNLLTELRKQYEERIISLHSNMKMVISKIENDDILASMRDDMDSTNSPLITNRIKEIIDDNLYKEKENIIEKLAFENASLKNKLNEIIKNKNNALLNSHQQLQIKNLEKVINELNYNIDSYNMELNNKNSELNKLQKKYNLINNELNKLKQDNLSFSSSFGNYDDFTQCKKNLINANKEIERLNKVINVIEIDLNSAEETQREKDEKIDKLMKELNEIKNQLINYEETNKKLIEENNNKENIIKKFENEQKELFNKYNSLNENFKKIEENKENNKGNDIEKKYKEKFKEMRTEITNLQKIINETKIETDLKDDKYRQAMEEMESNLKLVSEEWSNKLENTQKNYEIIIKIFKFKFSFPVI